MLTPTESPRAELALVSLLFAPRARFGCTTRFAPGVGRLWDDGLLRPSDGVVRACDGRHDARAGWWWVAVDGWQAAREGRWC